MLSETASAPVPHTGQSQGVPETIVGFDHRFRERRRKGRSRIARAVTVAINETNAGLVANLGEGGMRVQALGRPLPPGTNLRLQFQLPGSLEVIRASGVVAWVNDTAEAGIRFARLSRSLARRLREGMARNSFANAARELFGVAGGWQDAFVLVSQVARTLTGAGGVALTLAGEGRIYRFEDDDLPVRSTLAAPIYANQRIIGHLEISSPQLGAFDEMTLSTLPVLAALVSEMIELRAAGLRQPAPKTPGLPARIAHRIESMLPTVRVRIVP